MADARTCETGATLAPFKLGFGNDDRTICRFYSDIFLYFLCSFICSVKCKTTAWRAC
jgi:hypothetical protein